MNNLSLVDQNIFKFPSINKATSTDASAFFMLANSWFKLNQNSTLFEINPSSYQHFIDKFFITRFSSIIES